VLISVVPCCTVPLADSGDILWSEQYKDFPALRDIFFRFVVIIGVNNNNREFKEVLVQLKRQQTHKYN
jgi:hypothetical protein